MSKVQVERHGLVTVITINRPERRNAVDAATAALLHDAFVSFDSQSDAHVAVLTGAGGAFCSGYDLHSVAKSPPPYDSEGPGPMGPTRLSLGKPVIAAIEGHAVAGGLELALWCDLRVASQSAVFGVFCRQWGVPLIDGGTVRLPRIVGQGRALDMILTGRPVDAAESFAIGLADRVVPCGSALTEAIVLAENIARFPQTCMRADRLSAYKQWDLSLGDALSFEATRGEAPLNAEGLQGAERFSTRAHGSSPAGD